MDNTDCNTAVDKQMALNSRDFIKLCVNYASKLASHEFQDCKDHLFFCWCHHLQAGNKVK